MDSRTPPDISPALSRPFPPAELRERALVDEVGRFVPATELELWSRASFLEESSPLYNGTHKHLRLGRVGILWSNVGNRRQGRIILGQAEQPMARGGKWAKARHDQQLREWFLIVPDFLITLYAPWCASADDASFCALVEHELLHCGQARSDYGVPRFSRSTGKPIFAMRGHDSEEFVEIIERYGLGAVDSGTRALVAAASKAPTIAPAKIAAACGNCLARAA